MSEFKAGCSPITSKIYAGKVLSNGMWGANKKDITETAIHAVAQYFIQTNQSMEFNYGGERYVIKVEKRGYKSKKTKTQCQKKKP